MAVRLTASVPLDAIAQTSASPARSLTKRIRASRTQATPKVVDVAVPAVTLTVRGLAPSTWQLSATSDSASSWLPADTPENVVVAETPRRRLSVPSSVTV